MTDRHNLEVKYRALLTTGQMEYDAAQEKIISLLTDLSAQLILQETQEGRFFTAQSFKPVAFIRALFAKYCSSKPNINAFNGVYLWGGVGGGKTGLMNLFYETVPIKKKKRLHYHQFMLVVHQEMQTLRSTADPLPIIAQQMAQRYRLICLDEFYVMDIADAMLLYNLLKGLIDQGVTLVTTSNYSPDCLYVGGSQRDLFLPAIALLKTHTDVVELKNSVDYRLRYQVKQGVFIIKKKGEPTALSDALLLTQFNQYAQGRMIDQGTINILTHLIPTVRSANNIVWFEFSVICCSARSNSDYLLIAKQYSGVIISNITVMQEGDEAGVRRFVNLIDSFYDHHVQLMLSSELAVDELYQGRMLSFEFKRALSRLHEMQSVFYWKTDHLLSKKQLTTGFRLNIQPPLSHNIERQLPLS